MGSWHFLAGFYVGVIGQTEGPGAGESLLVAGTSLFRSLRNASGGTPLAYEWRSDLTDPSTHTTALENTQARQSVPCRV